MRRRYRTCSRRYNGVTLIEALGGLALIGVVLTGLIKARGDFTRQTYAAQRKAQAVALADRLLETWWADIDQFPIADHGAIPTGRLAGAGSGHPGDAGQNNATDIPGAGVGMGVGVGVPGVRWRTTVRPDEMAERLGARVVRLEIVDDRPTDAGKVLAAVEVLLPLSQEPVPSDDIQHDER